MENKENKQLDNERMYTEAQYNELKIESEKKSEQIIKLNEGINKLYSLYSDLLAKYLNN